MATWNDEKPHIIWGVETENDISTAAYYEVEYKQQGASSNRSGTTVDDYYSNGNLAIIQQ